MYWYIYIHVWQIHIHIWIHTSYECTLPLWTGFICQLCRIVCWYRVYAAERWVLMEIEVQKMKGGYLRKWRLPTLDSWCCRCWYFFLHVSWWKIEVQLVLLSKYWGSLDWYCWEKSLWLDSGLIWRCLCKPPTEFLCMSDRLPMLNWNSCSTISCMLLEIWGTDIKFLCCWSLLLI